MHTQNLFLSLDESGYFLSEEKRITDVSWAQEALYHLKILDNKILQTTCREQTYIVESFDEPLIAHGVGFKNDQWIIQAQYQTEFSFSLETLTLDEWDRFHGFNDRSIPFVFSNKAQNQFFDLLDSYSDDSITWQGEEIITPAHWSDEPKVEKENFWTEIYKTEINPGWNIGTASPILIDMVPRLKLPKSRVLVLGCGEGHDAALFANEGHIVTAVDISPEAIARAKKNYAQFENLSFVEKDIFTLPQSWNESFDIVVEHTCYCAINPTLRAQLVKTWNRLLAPGGSLLGIFFTMEKRMGPPFGTTEWEVRERLKKTYDFLFWGRWRNSLPSRQGRELFVFARKKYSP